ncbi:sugar phosphate nucleotidyltransferase [Planococcus shenhongbingii]|uniref:sugar phosphate nucleotidyltransferase n=1 Tax=Planococcus shenhongbingii TaxID=3058398 RepID=UPI002619E238|nr:sugar phosphate nucleotidyltransferase [Planococcus sp. N016]WKA57809.1 sugar phosphate nucleotidyltransferase [Planococcus sp. N016]
MKGIIVTGKSKDKFNSITKVIPKSLLPIHDKPMIYYPLSILMNAEIKEILVICNISEFPYYYKLLGYGDDLGIKIEYIEDEEHNSVADAFIIGEDFIGSDDVALILGETIFYGHESSLIIQQKSSPQKGATIFASKDKNTNQFNITQNSFIKKITSEIGNSYGSQSSFSIPDLYFYDNRVVEIVKTLKLSQKGIVDITDINNEYLKLNSLKIMSLGNEFLSLNTNTIESLAEATAFIKTIEKAQGRKIGCIEEIAFNMKYIDLNQLTLLAEPLLKSEYGQYLINIGEKELQYSNKPL